MLQVACVPIFALLEEFEPLIPKPPDYTGRRTRMVRLSRSMLEVEHICELGNLYNLRFIESDIFCPCLSTKLKLSTTTDSNLFIVS